MWYEERTSWQNYRFLFARAMVRSSKSHRIRVDDILLEIKWSGLMDLVSEAME